MTDWGTVLFNAYKKSRPILLDGTTSIAHNVGFSVKNPYILECLPDSLIKSASVFEGKKLQTVCRVIDNPELINRYLRFCGYLKGLKKKSPNQYLADLYKKLATHKSKPEIWLDFAKRAENGEIKGADLYTKIIDSEYDVLRLAEYDLLNVSPNISELTGKSTSKIAAIEQKGWHYRKLKGTPHFNPKYRISINANGNEKLIKTLDEYVNAQRYYKTPDYSANWLERHDPVTIYFKNKPTDAEINELVTRLKNCDGIRSTKDVLLGTKLYPGIAMQTSPDKQEVLSLIQRCYAASPDFGAAAERYLTNPLTKEIKASAGQVSAVENVLKNVIFT